MFLCLYLAAPVSACAAVGKLLFDAWVHAPQSEREGVNDRWRLAGKRFKTGNLYVSLLDDVQTGCAR